ncbi:MAG: hypothetical protein KDC38_17440, partial [Planctomycetes bacterium]|nr:hypothetical protein [Planctomycetota bacterium]
MPAVDDPRRRALIALLCALLWSLCAGGAFAGEPPESRDESTAAAPPAIEYRLRFPDPHTHYVEVEAIVPAQGRTVDLRLATWTPGSYLIREYARHIEEVTATDDGGAPLQVEKTAKNRWRVSGCRSDRIRVGYRVYGREMSVRTNWVERDFAIINGAPTFLTLVDATPREHRVAIDLPGEWRDTVTSLRPIAGVSHRYLAESYDELVDSPILCGNPA